MDESKLIIELTAALKDPKSAEDRIQAVSSEEIKSAAEAQLVVQVLKLFPLASEALERKRVIRSPLRNVLAWMQGVKDEATRSVFREHGSPELLRIFDELVRALSLDNNSSGKTDLPLLLKIVTLYVPAGGLERVLTGARSPLLIDNYLWSVIFNIVSGDQHPWRTQVIEALRNPLPDGFVGIAYLDITNALARSGKLEHHPFDTDAGLARLEAWLQDKDEDGASYAHSAAASIPFLSPSMAEKIQALADHYPDRGVRLEAAWAAAARGLEHGFETLEAACTVPQDASAAIHYLTELGAENRIPLKSKSEDFQAMAEMCKWLAHPSEMGSAPQGISQVDARDLSWPPTGDRRRLWVFRYEYPPREGKTELEVGYGMVGSVTFALFGESTAAFSADQIYGLHCAWELECNRDPRAPQKRTPEAGIEILKAHNPDFGRT